MRLTSRLRLTCSCALAKVFFVKRVALNMDLGELPDEPDEFYSLATMVNIACGGHAGDLASMQRALVLARDSDANVAAHPSYPDREAFGRKTLAISPAELERSLHDQMAQLVEIARNAGTIIKAVKPHGALYHDAANSGSIADSLLRAMDTLFDASIAVVGPPMGTLRDKAQSQGRPYLDEGFADRTYLPDGRLVPRSQPNALLTDPDEAATQAVHLAQRGQFDTLCVHGDTPNALAVARAVRKALMDAHLLDGV
jgi:5-oxoprolinase (ATP-hydrolysing) subunit A